MINVTNLERRSRLLVKSIVAKAKFNDSTSPLYAYWTLYLDDNRNKPREIDTCATSYCLSVLELDKQRLRNTGNTDPYRYHDIIQQAIRTILKLRSSSGAWPSVVEPKVLKVNNDNYSGDVAIGDNYYALTALMNVNFLSNSFEYVDNIDPKLQTIDGRIAFVCRSVDWLLNNQISSEEIGWYYTNTKSDNTIEPVTIATTNILTILNRIKNALYAIINSELATTYYSRIDETIKSILEYILDNIKSDGGIGKFICNPNERCSSLLHTCKLVDSFVISENVDYIDELVKAVEFIVTTCEQCNCSFEIKPASFYSEQYSLVLPSEDEITIRHENFTEGIILFTLINLIRQYQKSGSYVSKAIIDIEKITLIIDKVIRQLESMQTKDGAYNGLFRCHVTRNDGMHPVYASFEGYRAIRLYQTLNNTAMSQHDRKSLKQEISRYPFDSSQPYLFISYSHKDEDAVLSDVLKLKSQYNCWIDFQNLDGGRCNNENDWTEKVFPVLSNPLCKGVLLYLSKDGFLSNGLLFEAEYIQKIKPHFYTFLIGFSETLTPVSMAEILNNIEEPDPQLKLRRINAFSFVGQATAGFATESYYHRKENFSHLFETDFVNWTNKLLE